MRCIGLNTTVAPRGVSYSLINITVLLVLCVFLGRFGSLAFPSVDKLFQFIAIFSSILSSAFVLRHSHVSRAVYLYLLTLVALFMVQFVYTVVNLGQSPFHFFSAAYTYSFCLLVFPISFLFNELGDRTVFGILQKTAIAISVLMILSAIAKNIAGVNLIEAMRERGNSARFGEPELIDVMVIYSCWKLGVEERNKLNLLCFAFGILAIFYVSQTRVMEIVMLCSCFATLFWCLRGADKKALLICIGFFSALVLILSGAAGGFISSFSLKGDEAASTIARQGEIAYYLSAFCRNPLIGIGMIAYESPLHYLIGGPYGNFYPDDVGIIGALGTIGLLIIPLYGIPLILFIFRSIKSCRSVRPVLFGFIVYLIGTSATLLIVYPFCSPAWPLLISIFDYYKNDDYANSLGV